MRPTKYTPELLEKAREYLTVFDQDGSVIPTVAGLALHIGVARETCHVWAGQEGKEEFSNILADLLAIQERLLLNKGLAGEFNSAIAKLVLGKHGYHEKVDKQLTGEGGGPVEYRMTVEYVDPPDPDQ